MFFVQGVNPVRSFCYGVYTVVHSFCFCQVVVFVGLFSPLLEKITFVRVKRKCVDGVSRLLHRDVVLRRVT